MGRCLGGLTAKTASFAGRRRTRYTLRLDDRGRSHSFIAGRRRSISEGQWDESLLPPDSLFGYDILERIGEGAGSVVYAASNTLTGEMRALKHVVIRNRKDERLFAQLQAELEVGQVVRHPGLRKSLEMKVRRSWLRRPVEAVLLMELVDGQPIDTPPLSPMPTMCAIFAHGRGACRRCTDKDMSTAT